MASDRAVAAINASRILGRFPRLRLSATNLAPLDYVTGSGITVQDAGGLPLNEESGLTTARSSVKWQLRLEMKL